MCSAEYRRSGRLQILSERDGMTDNRKKAGEYQRVLMVAYHFPPCKISSGIQRTLKFADYLRESGWYGSVLSAHPRAYETTSDEQLGEIAEGVHVRRAWALDTRRHLAVRGRYVRRMALPDRWVSWWLGAVVSGLVMVRRERPAAIWSTYPIATAHLIGGTLHRLTGLPWIADFRDQMTEEGYPTDPVAWRSYRRIEEWTVARCAWAVFTTPGALRMYEARYPELMRGKGVVIPNGYAEENFAAVEAALPAQSQDPGRRLELLHSGALYPEERDPRPFFRALARLRAAARIDAESLRVTLRATGHDDVHAESARAAGVEDLIVFAPALPYADALREMMSVDGLLLFQATVCNHQIPAKVYEYFRAARPVLTLTDATGDTAAAVREAGLDHIVPLDDADGIERGLGAFLDGLRDGSLAGADPDVTARYSRRALTARLADLLDEVIEE